MIFVVLVTFAISWKIVCPSEQRDSKNPFNKEPYLPAPQRLSFLHPELFIYDERVDTMHAYVF